jgi:hypothetical protein
MDETKKILYLKNEIEEKGLDFIKESFKNPNLKEIYFLGIYNHKKLGALEIFFGVEFYHQGNILPSRYYFTFKVNVYL